MPSVVAYANESAEVAGVLGEITELLTSGTPPHEVEFWPAQIHNLRA